jgi:hypothetical protein
MADRPGLRRQLAADADDAVDGSGTFILAHPDTSTGSDPDAAEIARLRQALEDISGEAGRAGSALCAHELEVLLENIRRRCAEVLSAP